MKAEEALERQQVIYVGKNNDIIEKNINGTIVSGVNDAGMVKVYFYPDKLLTWCHINDLEKR